MHLQFFGTLCAISQLLPVLPLQANIIWSVDWLTSNPIALPLATLRQPTPTLDRRAIAVQSVKLSGIVSSCVAVPSFVRSFLSVWSGMGLEWGWMDHRIGRESNDTNQSWQRHE